MVGQSTKLPDEYAINEKRLGPYVSNPSSKPPFIPWFFLPFTTPPRVSDCEIK